MRWFPFRKRHWWWVFSAASCGCAAVGSSLARPDLVGCGLGLGAYFALRAAGVIRFPRPEARQIEAPADPSPAPEPAAVPADPTSLVETMLAQGRYALLLRPQVVANLTPEQESRARQALADECALTPPGEIEIAPFGHQPGEDQSHLTYETLVYFVESHFLDRDPVTNRQFYEFVRAGGYEQMSIWDPQIWPAVFHFVDQTGRPGPRFWKHGRYAPEEADHPVVGVCWHEAAAYARWVGKRLPSDPEWQKAAAWPMQMQATGRPQRRYPWGDTLEPGRCNVHSACRGRVVSVGEFAEGESVGGVRQLIGNVWEWTAADFAAHGDMGDGLVLPTAMKMLRGGAFDTYFDSQSTCQFQSGDDALARKHNIGFRCALSASDVAAAEAHRDAPGDSDSSEEPALAGEVSGA